MAKYIVSRGSGRRGFENSLTIHLLWKIMSYEIIKAFDLSAWWVSLLQERDKL
jgi:hypothetical protein